MCDYCKFVRRIFVHSLLLNLMQRLDSSNCRSVISDFIFNVPHGKMVYPPKIYLPTLIIDYCYSRSLTVTPGVKCT